jgi:hypothetical protein
MASQNGGTMRASLAEPLRFIGASVRQRHEVCREAHVQMGVSFYRPKAPWRCTGHL